MSDTFTVRYSGSLEEFSGRIGCATAESGSDRYTVRLWGMFGEHETLRHVRRQSIQVGTVTVYPGAVCRCGGEHSRWPD